MQDRIQNVLIIDAKIDYIGNKSKKCDKQIDIKKNLLLPGIIDPHVHVRDLMQSYKEDWASASNAAVKGGITSVIDMPNSIPPTINQKNLRSKRIAAQKAEINKKFNLGATENNLDELEKILTKKPEDIAGIKIFLAASSNNELIYQESTLIKIFKLAKKFDRVVIVHTELQECINKWSEKIRDKTIFNHNKIRNRECAIKGTELVLKIANKVKNKLYLAHISTSEEIELIRKFKENNQIFCEITPHHLLLNEEILKECGNFGKVNPPLRNKEDNQSLWEAILDGTVDTIGSDHAPHSIAEKKRVYPEAPSGFPGMETMLPLLLKEYNSSRISLNKLITLTSKNPANIFNFQERGEIKVGNYADLTIVDLEKKWKIKAKNFSSKAKYSPFENMEIQGKPVITMVNGKIKFRGEI